MFDLVCLTTILQEEIKHIYLKAKLLLLLGEEKIHTTYFINVG